VAILDELEQVIGVGFANLQLQKSPHLALVSKNFYEYVSSWVARLCAVVRSLCESALWWLLIEFSPGILQPFQLSTGVVVALCLCQLFFISSPYLCFSNAVRA
jgi:hypothetical protein